MIGKEWCFVRVHDAVQVCLQHVQKLNWITPNVVDGTPRMQLGSLQNLRKHEGGGDSMVEPLLSMEA